MAIASSGLMSNSAALTKHLKAVAHKVGEPLWELPMWPELDKEVRSSVADYKNITAPNIGARSSTAGVFLKAFAGKTPWAHLDIAGTAWDCKSTGHPATGASGYGVRTLANACYEFRGLK